MSSESHSHHHTGKTVAEGVRETLRDVLGLSQSRVDAFSHETELFGALPEIDSLAVASILTGIEDRFGILVEDDDFDADTFATLGSLIAFVESKLDR